jgi:hypothetical protein
MTITTTFVTVLRRFKYLAEKVMYSNHYKVIKIADHKYVEDSQYVSRLQATGLKSRRQRGVRTSRFLYLSVDFSELYPTLPLHLVASRFHILHRTPSSARP